MTKVAIRCRLCLERTQIDAKCSTPSSTAWGWMVQHLREAHGMTRRRCIPAAVWGCFTVLYRRPAERLAA